MRSLLLAGVATLALGTSMTPVAAQAFLLPGLALAICTAAGVGSDSAQVQCAANHVADPGFGDNDDNTQDFDQVQARQSEDPWNTLQLQLGANIVVDGDGNSQYGDQYQSANTPQNSTHEGDEPLQVQAAGNLVINGDDNYQRTDQSQTFTSQNDDDTNDTEQFQGALNSVDDGNGNSQEITQSQTALNYD